MDKLKMTSKGAVPSNVEKIAALFPNCVTERLNKDGNPEAVVDFDKLRQELSTELVEGAAERYQFTWPDKRAANHLANQPTTMTLRPCEEESVGRDGTNGVFDSENLYIEGDNLDVLKVLRETYLGKVKMIYIDPPYNTGNDFVYNDDFAESYEEFAESCKVRDEDGNLTFDPKANGESNGRFHTDWLNMIYPRLKVARDLLTDDGAIFVSIGQNEVVNLDKIMSEIYGSQNKINIVTRIMKSGGGKGQFFSPNIEFIVIYAKDISNLNSFREPISEEIIKKLYTSIELNGPHKGEKYRPFGLYQSSLDPMRGCSNQRYYIEAPDGTLLIPPGNSLPKEQEDGAMIPPKTREDKVWRWSRQRYFEEKAKGNIEFKKSNGVLLDANGNPAQWNVYSKIWLSDRQEDGATPVDIITKWENRHSAKELQELDIPFDFAKPTELIKYLIVLMPKDSEATILDFFSGSASTAHAVMKLNAEDGGNRKFIMVQLPEVTEIESEARKVGYNTICEIGKERIRRAGKQILESLKPNDGGLFANAAESPKLDIGFRVLKLAESNMENVYYSPDKLDANNLFTLEDNVKTDRTAEDLLFQVMLELGVELSSPIEKKSINGVEVFNVKDGFLIATFDKNVNESTITEIAKIEPVYFVMRDASAANDNVLDNFDQLFRHYSPDTIRRIL
jgi:adenine-specific DNA-methyltransferase